LDEKIRGFVEKAWDDALATDINLTPTVKWIQDAFPVKSSKDLILGYAVGVLEREAHDIIIILKGTIAEEDDAAIEQMLTRRLPEISEKIQREMNT